jgi:hypothetical protein
MFERMFETIILIFLVMFIIIYKQKYISPVVAIEAFNNQAYLVNDLPDSQEAANMLARVMLTLAKLVDLIVENYDQGKRTPTDDKYIKYVRRIKRRLPNVKISENPTNSNYTSYSINKGEELVFCIRNKINFKIHDINVILYVAVHEIAHIGCPEVGHTDLFTEINMYLLSKAVCYGLYKYVDYFYSHEDYCGMTLTSTILPSNINCDFK